MLTSYHEQLGQVMYQAVSICFASSLPFISLFYTSIRFWSVFDSQLALEGTLLIMEFNHWFPKNIQTRVESLGIMYLREASDRQICQISRLFHPEKHLGQRRSQETPK
jgi:hypothetical protein